MTGSSVDHKVFRWAGTSPSSPTSKRNCQHAEKMINDSQYEMLQHLLNLVLSSDQAIQTFVISFVLLWNRFVPVHHFQLSFSCCFWRANIKPHTNLVWIMVDYVTDRCAGSVGAKRKKINLFFLSVQELSYFLGFAKKKTRFSFSLVCLQHIISVFTML